MRDAAIFVIGHALAGLVILVMVAMAIVAVAGPVVLGVWLAVNGFWYLVPVELLILGFVLGVAADNDARRGKRRRE